MTRCGRLFATFLAGWLAACSGDAGSGDSETPADGADSPAPVAPDQTVMRIEGLSGPESVRYDPDQDVWFVGNFGSAPGDEGDGFVSRVSAADGSIEALRFAVGTDEHPMVDPRGTYITGDTLWVADMYGVHGVDRRSGEHHTFIDMTAFSPGFLNDIAQGADGALYVTDTGRSAVFRIEGREVTEAASDASLGNPNGITWDPVRETLVLVPWEPGHRIQTWAPGAQPEGIGPDETPGRLDGVEPVEGGLLYASQSDTSLRLLADDGSHLLIRTEGAPADIGVDAGRGLVAVPYIALDRVDVFRLPAR